MPRAPVGRSVAASVRTAVADVRSGAHERPERRRVLGTARVPGRVAEIGQAEIVRVLVREDAEASVLGLDGVVADPDAGRVARDRHAARHAAATGVDAREAARSTGLNGRVPAVAPDRVGAVIWVTGGLVAARVDDLEVVDEPVRLLEVAIAVEVVPVPLVERLEIVRGLRNRLARGQLALDPERHGVADQEPGVVADDAVAEVAAVASLVERHLDPAVHVAADRARKASGDRRTRL